MTINGIEFAVDCFTVIEELKTQLNINGIPLLNKIVDTPSNIQVCCPYHKNGQERRPSAGIRKSDGMFHCLACGETHTLSEMISHCFGRTDDILGKFGWKWLLKNFVTIQVENRNDIELDFGRNTDIRKVCADDNSDDVNNSTALHSAYVSEEELDSYRYYHPYWKKRGIVDEQLIELFDLGYDKDTDCITMPIRDKDGTVVFVARRSVKTKWFNYPQGVLKPIYGLYEYYLEGQRRIDNQRPKRYGKTYLLKQLNEVFICESMIDALLLWQAGYYAFALNGLGSSYQFAELQKLPIRKYILCTDNDDAGRSARKVIQVVLRDSKILTEINFPPNRKDVGECTKEEIENILDWEVL